MHADTVYIFIVNHFRVRRNKNLPKELKYMKFNLLLVMSEQNLFCPTKMVSLVGHMFFQEKKNYGPVNYIYYNNNNNNNNNNKTITQ